jgi:hypothetical protein
MHIKQTHISSSRPNLLKEHVSPTHRLTVIKNNETPTRGIKHWGLSGYSNILPRIKFGVTGQESSPQSPTISYRHPLATSLKKENHVFDV